MTVNGAIKVFGCDNLFISSTRNFLHCTLDAKMSSLMVKFCELKTENQNLSVLFLSTFVVRIDLLAEI